MKDLGMQESLKNTLLKILEYLELNTITGHLIAIDIVKELLGGLDELSNNEIMDYCNARPEMKQGEFIGLFREPDKTGEMWLEKKGVAHEPNTQNVPKAS